MVGILEGETGDWASEEGCIIDRDVGEFEKRNGKGKGGGKKWISGKVEKKRRGSTGSMCLHIVNLLLLLVVGEPRYNTIAVQ